LAYPLLPHWIDGKNDSAPPVRTGDIFDPATGQKIAEVAYADAAQTDRTVDAARRAAAAWGQTPVTRRSAVLFRFRQLLGDHQRELAKIIALEHGKTVDDAAGEITRGLEVVEFACGIPQLLKGGLSPNVATGVDLATLREPLGVVAGITPFNFPAMVGLWMHPVAIACGNAFVLKPSERDPSVTNRIAELWGEAGLPEGVFNVLHGDRVAVERLLEHPDIKAVSFVGSTPVARHIYQTASQHGKRVQALGGAKNHMVVLPDADLELAADSAVSAAYGSAGERCMAISVVAAVGDTADRLVPLLEERIGKIRVGPASDPESEMGPVITRVQRDRIRGLVDEGVEQGAALLCDGRSLEVPGHEEGFFIGPCLFDQVTPEMSIYREEIFGPVLCVVRCEGFEEAIDLVNANPYANGTAIFTHDGGAARRFQRDIEVGMVGINVPIPVPLGFHSFGGWKNSIFGSHGIYGEEGVHFYTRQKVTTSRWPDPSQRGVDLGFPPGK